jgi:hypothetical protein
MSGYPVTVVKSNKGKDLFKHRGHLYTKNKESKDGLTIYANCNLKTKGCKVSLNLVRDENGYLFKSISSCDHNHEMQVTSIVTKEFRSKLLARAAANPTLSAPTLHEIETNSAFNNPPSDIEASTEEFSRAIPIYDAVRSSIYRELAKNRPPLPKSASEIVLPDSFKTTDSGEDFVFLDDTQTVQLGNGETREERILAFTTYRHFSQLLGCKAPFFMDGTFSVAPPCFYQLYTIHSVYQGLMVPFIWILLPGKSETLYTRMLRLIKEKAISLGLTLEPESFYLDYEIAVFNSIKAVFGLETVILGCHFHFCQAINRKVQKLGLQNGGPEIRKLYKCLGALALLDPEKLEDGWLAVQELVPETDPHHATSVRLLDYFVDTWFGESALFDRAVWNHYNNFQIRTTNHIEGYHTRLVRRLSVSHPNIFKFIDFMKGELATYTNRMAQISVGQRLPRKNQAFIEKNELFKKHTQDLDSGNISASEFLLLVGPHLAF